MKTDINKSIKIGTLSLFDPVVYKCIWISLKKGGVWISINIISIAMGIIKFLEK